MSVTVGRSHEHRDHVRDTRRDGHDAVPRLGESGGRPLSAGPRRERPPGVAGLRRPHGPAAAPDPRRRWRSACSNDAHELAKTATRAGVHAELFVYPDMPHRLDARTTPPTRKLRWPSIRSRRSSPGSRADGRRLNDSRGRATVVSFAAVVSALLAAAATAESAGRRGRCVPIIHFEGLHGHSLPPSS